MIGRPGKTTPAGTLFLLLAATPGMAQGIAFDANRVIADPDWSVYRLAYTQRIVGPLGGSLYGTYLTPRGGDRDLYGVGASLSLFQGGTPGPYVMAGIEGGATAGASEAVWNGWWAGAGFEVVPFDFLALGIEGRWHSFSPPEVSGVEVGGRIQVFWSTGGPPPQPAFTEVQPADPVPGEPEVRATLVEAGASSETADKLGGVVAAATGAMGTPYVWGGTGGDDGGFDCSGLIQYAYGTQGISLPRVSRDQAKQGHKLPKKLDALRPGDILTFSTRGGPVTHVGLYVGDGQFIHSASQGVQLSRLSSDDPYGRWWFKRWVGARRILQ
ncbi:MAG: C40 family peptidase [Gemmatimonadales bacterium]